MTVFLIALMVLGGVHASKQDPKVILNDKGEVLRDENFIKTDSSLIKEKYNYEHIQKEK